MKWHIDSDGNAYNELGFVISPYKLGNGFAVALWLPQIDLYDDLLPTNIKSFATEQEARRFIQGYVQGYNDKVREDNVEN